jgi:hypothetical protein
MRTEKICGFRTKGIHILWGQICDGIWSKFPRFKSTNVLGGIGINVVFERRETKLNLILTVA